jgi:carbon monoxide dehydrogenase subunit G
MPITKALVFDKVTVNAVDLTPHLADSAEVTVEPINQTVSNGQTLPSAWNVSFSVSILNTNAATAAVYSDSTAEPVSTFITFSGVTGAATLNITDVIITATPDFSGERVAYVLTGSKVMTNIANVVSIT